MAITIISFLVSLLILPYVFFIWVYGIILVKRIIEKEWRKPHDVLKAYEHLTPDQRMQMNLHPLVEKSAWLDSPSPEEALLKRQQVEKQERLRQGTWESASPEVPPLSRLP